MGKEISVLAKVSVRDSKNKTTRVKMHCFGTAVDQNSFNRQSALGYHLRAMSERGRGFSQSHSPLHQGRIGSGGAR